MQIHEVLMCPVYISHVVLVSAPETLYGINMNSVVHRVYKPNGVVHALMIKPKVWQILIHHKLI